MAIVPINVFIDDVYQRIGKIRQEKQYTKELRPDSKSLGAGKEYGLALHWQAEGQPFLTLEAKRGDHNKFDVGWVAATPTFQSLGADPEEDFKKNNKIVTAKVQPGEAIYITFVVDTDNAVFCKRAEEACRKAGAGYKKLEPELPIKIGAWMFAPGMDNIFLVINLVLRKISRLQFYKGYVAIDVGNTASTLVCLPPDAGRPLTGAMKILDGNMQGAADLKDKDLTSIHSQVRIDAVVDNFDDYPDAASWVIGSGASVRIDGLVMSPKRLVAGDAWDKKQVFNAAPDPELDSQNTRLGIKAVELERRIPAELLVCKMLQRFRQASHFHPEFLALTYPTTYRPKELSHLRQVVYHGYERSRWERHDQADGEDKVKERVPVVLDEASAAAYFFLYRRILDSQGGLPRFRYLYPQGLNLLLYDCGGGTTDIALVNAGSEPGSNKLTIGVRARSGVRGFGGDDITVAVFRILKTKLAFAIDGLLNDHEIRSRSLGTQDFPEKLPDHPLSADHLKFRFPKKEVTPKVLDNFLSALAAEVNRLVPTRFDSKVMDPDNRRNRGFCLELSQWAESVKKKLATAAENLQRKLTEDANKKLTEDAKKKLMAEASSVSLGVIGGSLRDHLTEPFKVGVDSETFQIATNALSEIRIHRWEVDNLVRGQIEKSVVNCNKLIRNKLVEDGQEVQWVVVSGNGARYPLIQELLKEKLAVQFIGDKDRFLMDAENLKHAVAKGAVLYLMSMYSQKDLDVSFDTNLSERLPYHVCYQNPVTHTKKRLFHEHDLYEKIAHESPKPIEAQQRSSESATDRVDSRRVFLLKCWPEDAGLDERDDVCTSFMHFDFESDVKFPLKVSFNPEKTQFEVTDEEGKQGEAIEEVEPGIYNESPFQTGDL